MTEPRLGRLYGLGVGPGDPELVTLKAARILQSVPVICLPNTGTHEDGYAVTIVKGLIDPARQELVTCVFPMTKDRQKLLAYWERAVEAIVERLRQGKDVAFITEGDPFVYSTFIYIYDLVRRQHPEVEVEVVPGVSSLTAAPVRSGVPLVNREERLAVLPATYEGEELRRTLQQFDAVILMKVNSVFDRVLDLLEELGLVEHTVYVRRGTSSEEEIVRDIRTLKGQKLDYMSLLVVHRPGRADEAPRHGS